MTGTKTIAERLREAEGLCEIHGMCRVVLHAINGEATCPSIASCVDCKIGILRTLARQIEAEQAQAVSKALIEDVVKQENIDSDLLYNAAKDLQENAHIIKESVLEDLAHCAGLIRKVLKGAKPQLPEGVIWPTYEDGELVKFGDVARVREDIGEVIEVRFHSGKCSEVTIAFEGESTATHYMVVDGPHLKRHEPEVLDADGVPIKVGDTVWYTDELPTKKFVGDRCTVKTIERVRDGYSIKVLNEDRGHYQFDLTGRFLTHRKPDTKESVRAEIIEAVKADYAVNLLPLFERYEQVVLREVGE